MFAVSVPKCNYRESESWFRCQSAIIGTRNHGFGAKMRLSGIENTVSVRKCGYGKSKSRSWCQNAVIGNRNHGFGAKMQLSGVEIMASASKNNFRIVFAPKCHFREPNVCIDGGGTPLWGVPQQLFRLRQERESMGEVTPQKGGYPPYEAHGTNLTPIMGYPERNSRQTTHRQRVGVISYKLVIS